MNMWLDLNTSFTSGYSWSDGNEAIFKDFEDESSHEYGGVCFKMDYEDGHRWEAESCGDFEKYICKWPL